MLINVTGRQFEITPAIQTQAETVLSSLDIPALKVSSVNVVMSREKNHFQVSLVLNCKYHTLKAEVVSMKDSDCLALFGRRIILVNLTAL